MRLAVFFMRVEEIGIDVIDLLIEPQAVEIAQLRENGNGLLARDVADRNPPPVDARGGGELRAGAWVKSKECEVDQFKARCPIQ